MVRASVAVALVALLVIGNAAFAQKESAEGGDYYVTGTELDGREYSGGMEILEVGDAYVVSYQLGTLLYGAGLLVNDVLVVASGDGSCTAAAYTRSDDGLEGQWTGLGTGSIQTERAVLMSNQGDVLDMALTGQSPDGTRYEGGMTLTTTSDVTVNIEQSYGGSTYNGTGIIVRDVYAVAYGAPSCSVAAYEVQDDGSLVGSWTVVGETRVASETAVPVNIVGAHRVSGTNQDGSTYEGTLDVSADNQVHTFTWVVNGTTLQGVGILRGNIVTAAFGSDQCAVMSYFVTPNGGLSGQWAFIGTDKAGSEVALIGQGKAAQEDLSGAYEVTGVNPDGSEYSGRLNVLPNDDGETLGLTWVFGTNEPVEGVGIRLGNMLLVGYGPRECGLNVFNVNLNEMSGPFAQVGIAGTGSERAVR